MLSERDIEEIRTVGRNTMGNSDRLKLIAEVYEKVLEETASFEEGLVGADLAYLLGSIALNSEVDWWEGLTNERPVAKIIKEKFPKSHDVWLYIRRRKN